MVVHKERIQDKGQGFVCAKGMGVRTAWLIREPNGSKCLGHEVVGEVRRWEVAGDQKRWEAFDLEWKGFSHRDERKCLGL